MTKTEQLASGLKRIGFREVTSPSRKYRKFEGAERVYPIWLGKAGALRSGPKASDTTPLDGTPFYIRVMANAG